MPRIDSLQFAAFVNVHAFEMFLVNNLFPYERVYFAEITVDSVELNSYVAIFVDSLNISEKLIYLSTKTQQEAIHMCTLEIFDGLHITLYDL